MAQDYTLGKWIKEKFGSQRKFGAKIGAHPTLVSRWMGGGGISEEYQVAIRKLGYTGPWPADETQDAGVPVPSLTREEFAEWRGYFRGGMEKVLERLEDLARRIEAIEKRLS